MIKAIKVTFIILILIFKTANSFAQAGVAFGSGQGINSITPYRLAMSWDFGKIWKPDMTWGLVGIWESSFAVWNGPQRPDLDNSRSTDLNASTTGPMLRWQRNSAYGGTSLMPYVELGVGLSWLSQKEIQGRFLSLHFQFEDKIGIGVRMGPKQQYDFSLRAYHYSNASIKRPNSGVNLAMASIGFWFPS